MKNYKNFKTDDFVCDDEFIAWCLAPDAASDAFWNNWIQTHPEHKLIVLEAKQLVLDLRSIETEENNFPSIDSSLGLDFETEIWDKIDSNISEKSTTRKIPTSFDWVLSSAAGVLFLVCAFIVFQTKTTFDSSNQIANSDWINFENNSGITKRIQLPDNSTVVLEPFSVLKYPNKFTSDQREVFLKGEAFFDIVRDTTKPFLVYANETITKVLGTSFRITAFEGDENVEVDVKTGKVAVYAKVASNEKGKSKPMILEADVKILIPQPNKKLEITPNQKVVFNRKKEDMIRKVTALPRVITKVEELPQFKFSNESVVKVFEAFEQAYGIDLEYDAESLSSCTITTKLDNEPLFQKLNIICMALGLKFSEKDAVIFIEGGGC